MWYWELFDSCTQTLAALMWFCKSQSSVLMMGVSTIIGASHWESFLSENIFTLAILFSICQERLWATSWKCLESDASVTKGICGGWYCGNLSYESFEPVDELAFMHCMQCFTHLICKNMQYFCLNLDSIVLSGKVAYRFYLQSYFTFSINKLFSMIRTVNFFDINGSFSLI